MEWLWAIATLIIGFGGGIFFGRYSSAAAKNARALEAQLKTAREELEEYKGQVTQHFARTAELVDALAANSRDIYHHLARGSEQLCGSDIAKLGVPGSTMLQEEKTEQEEALPAADKEASQASESSVAQVVKPEQGQPEADSDDVPSEPPPSEEEAIAQSSEEWSEILPQKEEEPEQRAVH